ncbi:carbon-monoxide dehydrogenase medium subunit [Kibdelosporangium banguiense]|uniref:Carbon-monoxide dehydrogenase medium subunit n=1 Tax=Kibdelosporangium banguiense TaxID=1365924 RepID=A0ABS4TMJ0_9PSEU|nr:carbon-monoxide dehydrogenase medium subunit [Kibdelosporangium banguiense]
MPAPFQYQKAASVEHALTLLAQYGTESMVVAGGHSLLPMMKLRLAHPEALIDINGLDLADIRLVDSRLRIGALVRHAALLSSSLAGTHLPILHDAERVIADPIVRNRGTVGGSLCQADPSEDLSAAFAALRASLIAVGPAGKRTIPARDFFTGPYETALDHGELLTEIQAPVGKASAYVKVERRAGDWAVGAACAVLTISADGIVTDAGIGLAALGATRFVAAEAEDFLCGGPATEERFAEAGKIAAEHCNPSADQRGPVVYKRHLAGELTTRALRLAASRAA